MSFYYFLLIMSRPLPNVASFLEDDGDICFLLNLILKYDNVNIEQVNTPAQANVFLKEETPDGLIMDNNYLMAVG